MTSELLNISGYRKWLIVWLLLPIGLVAQTQDSALTVISNIEGAPANMKMSELKSIVKGERQRWPDGNKVKIVLMLTKTKTGKITCARVYQWSSNKVLSYWASQTLAFKADAPVFCNSAEELTAYVAENPGAIGITDKQVSDPNIKVVTIDGRKSF